ncbi:hypothetical protein D3OALGA1CA_4285 [Olavius algarvensis associated proteobacterium Delta 3]|nr:hypothetical protein D3OALGA1CA_4285 [Olavius algarvensis associated proteobacterium Delta 3]
MLNHHDIGPDGRWRVRQPISGLMEKIRTSAQSKLSSDYFYVNIKSDTTSVLNINN